MNAFLQWLSGLGSRLKCWIVVAPWERAVRVRLGRSAVTLEPGPHFRIPVLDDVKLVNTRLRIAQVPVGTATTRDGRAVAVGMSVGFHVTDPLEAMRALAHPEACLAALVVSCVPRIVATADLEALRIPELEAAVLKEVVEAAPGIKVDFVRATDFAPVRAFRMLSDNWRIGTHSDAHDRDS